MRRAGFITPCGPFDQPVSHFRTALLTVTMTLSVIFCVLLLTIPPQLHVINIDIGIREMRNGAGSPLGDPAQRRGRDRWEVLRRSAGTARCDRLSAAAAGSAARALEPDPDVRYENFIEILAVIKRANVKALQIDYDPPSMPPPPKPPVKGHCAEHYYRLPLE